MATGHASDRITISRLAWEMAQWELHYLRGRVGQLWVDAQLGARHAEQQYAEYQAQMQRALRDPDFRATRPTAATKVPIELAVGPEEIRRAS